MDTTLGKPIFYTSIVKKTTTGQRSIKFKGGKLWNDLPSSIRIHRGKYTFQRKLKLYLLNRIDN